jgi:hypothetical protein
MMKKSKKQFTSMQTVVAGIKGVRVSNILNSILD